jgi:hypothetical protein
MNLLSLSLGVELRQRFMGMALSAGRSSFSIDHSPRQRIQAIAVGGESIRGPRALSRMGADLPERAGPGHGECPSVNLQLFVFTALSTNFNGNGGR